MIAIVAHKSEWAAEFAAQASRLRAALGELAERIDHIGSTAVAGLDAKDILDIQVTVAKLSPVVAAALQAAGYVQLDYIRNDHVPPGGMDAADEWSKLLFREPVGERRMNIHVRQSGRSNQRYPLLFRDYLRAHPASATAYAELKRRLAANLADMAAYPDVKDPAADLIYLAAEEWAAATGWQLPTVDV